MPRTFCVYNWPRRGYTTISKIADLPANATFHENLTIFAAVERKNGEGFSQNLRPLSDITRKEDLACQCAENLYINIKNRFDRK